MKHAETEVVNGCDKPKAWKEGDGPGPNKQTSELGTLLTSMRKWKIFPTPANPLNISDWHKDMATIWDPTNKRLSDLGVVFALIALPRQFRIQHLQFDFDSPGDIRKTRVPRGPTVIFQMNNIRWVPVYKD
jgi:hypothetical protein